MGAAKQLPSNPFTTAQAVAFKPADNNRRVVAFIIDAVISSSLSKLIEFALKPCLGHYQNLSGILAFVATAVVYWTVLTLEFGATPGKKIMGLKIIRADEGLELSYGQIFLRETAGRLVSLLPLGLGYLWVSFDKKKRQTFHDKVAKTMVIDYR